MKGLRRKIAVLVMTLAVLTGAAPFAADNMMQVQAAEFSVTESKAVLYSNDHTKVYRLPDENSGAVTTIASGIPVNVTGITSNGWFRISLNGVYYVPGYGLESRNSGNTNHGERFPFLKIRSLAILRKPKWRTWTKIPTLSILIRI